MLVNCVSYQKHLVSLRPDRLFALEGAVEGALGGSAVSQQCSILFI